MEFESDLKTPVLFIIFNRIETARNVFKEIRKIRPKKLFIASDGGRNTLEHTLCVNIRNEIMGMIDWECDLKTKFNEINLGSGLNVSRAIDWFFESVEEGIILEDDCLPNKSFFSFCENLLEKYRYRNEIFVIGGVNFQNKKKKVSSYYFTRYGHTWGWATWKRAWQHYDYNLQKIEEPKYIIKVNEQFETDLERSFFTSIFDLCKDTNSMKSKGIDAWDYQWVITQIYNSAINITPSVNLIQNIGFDKKATHTKAKIKGISYRKTTGIKKIIHPKILNIDKDADYYTFYKTNLIYNWSELKKKKKFSLLMHIKNFAFYGLKKAIKKLVH